METIVISRTDNLGDVILSLPLAALIKEKFPSCKVIFLGKTYTLPIIDACENIDKAVNWDLISDLPKTSQIEYFKSLKADAIVHVFPNKKISQLALKAGIKARIGSARRLHQFLSCNKRLYFGRKNSTLHESQLNAKLLAPLGITQQFNLQQLGEKFALTKVLPLNKEISELIDPGKFNLILHPKSKGSAREWGLENFSKLIELLPEEKFKIFITGSLKEGELMRSLFIKHDSKIINLTGKFELSMLISFIAACDGLVAASTGPLHLAAALQKYAWGLFAPMRPVFPTRWAPLGAKSHVFVKNITCNKCRHSNTCECILSIEPEMVAQEILKAVAQ